MGRGPGQGGAANVPVQTRAHTATSMSWRDESLRNMLAGFQQIFYQASGLTPEELAGLTPAQRIRTAAEASLSEFDRLSQIAAEKKNTDLGRGGRLMIAVNDMLEATSLAHSDDPADREFARVIAENSMRHIGRIMATVAPRHQFTEHWRQLIEEYAGVHGREQVAFLRSHRLISDQEADELNRDIVSLYVDAFASRTANPRWIGYNSMERAARTEEALLRLPSAGSEADRVIANALRDTGELKRKSRQYVDDPRHRRGEWDVMRNANSTLTLARSALAALSDPETRRLNLAMSNSGMLSRHDDLVARYARPLADVPVMALSRREWLDQIANSNQYITRDNTGVLANHTRRFGILLSPTVARTAMNDHHGGDYSEVLLHEKFHTTQHRPERRLAYTDDLHRLWEEDIWQEGGVQALTLHALGEHQPSWDDSRSAISGYAMITAATRAVADSTGRNRRDFLVGLVSGCEDNERTGYVAAALTGDSSPDAQQRVLRTLDPVMYEWEAVSDVAHQYPDFRDQLNAALRSLTDSHSRLSAAA
jgi:hypothetical protein